MCRNIKTLSNFAPPATDAEILAAALQLVRKVSGTRTPSAANAAAFDDAVASVAGTVQGLLDGWVSHAPARNRELEAEKAKARSRQRFG